MLRYLVIVCTAIYHKKSEKNKILAKYFVENLSRYFIDISESVDHYCLQYSLIKIFAKQINKQQDIFCVN
jgi:hypothetical protein